MLKEFREFAIKGNMIDLAVGVMLGTAFGNIVNSLVKDVLMPPIGLLAGSVDFSDRHIDIGRGPEGTIQLSYGLFINSIVNFLIVAFALFFVVRAINRIKREPDAPSAHEPSDEVKLLGEIRDLLKVRA